MPTPGKKESQKEFIGRCIPIVKKEGPERSQDQVIAICYSMWRNRHKKNKSAEEQRVYDEIYAALEAATDEFLDKIIDAANKNAS